ncbi:MAG: DNA-binding protein Alba [Candidatus Aenigmarchaeota archaeon]|nr:DNA-binding protein Alba [Candidatus Aenigmarchaeota archaeon]
MAETQQQARDSRIEERPDSRSGYPQRPKREENVIFVGKKPTMSYVLAVMTQFSAGTKEVHIKARGRSISRAVDVAEVVRNRFATDVKHTVDIGTDEVTDEKGNKINVSTIDVKMNK